ncbi:MAG: hypothetical protein HYX34_10230 [Actinobacteria bacterium]|nr:hypothetical protein [Actinomycetota bacterium]
MPKLTSRNWIYLLLHVIVFVVGVLFVRERGAVASGVGASLIAAAIAGWVLFVWVMVNQEQARRLDVLAGLGLIDAFTARSSQIKQRYDDRLAGARQSIDIMGFGLRQLREDYLNDFSSWAARAHVRILLIDPDAPGPATTYATQRDTEEGNAVGGIASDVREFLAQTADVRQRLPEGFQVRLYSALPSINIFRVDDELFWGPYLVKTQSRNTPTFLVSRGGGLFDRLVEHFEALWNDPSLSHPPPAPAPADP